MTGAVRLLPAASQAILATVFTVAALSKVLELPDLQRTLERLGTRQTSSRPAALGLVTIEFVTGVALASAPLMAWPRVLVVALAVAFAAAGVKALLTKQQISCSCFGPMRPGLLGWRQIVLLPCWIALAVLASLGPPDWSISEGLLGLATVLSGLTLCRIPAQLHLWRELRADRVALQAGWGLPPIRKRRVVLR